MTKKKARVLENEPLFTLQEIGNMGDVARRKALAEAIQICLTIAVALNESSKLHATRQDEKLREMAPLLATERLGALKCVAALRKLAAAMPLPRDKE